MTLHAILLVPAEGDPYDLLKRGPCGACPPLATQHVHREQRHSEAWFNEDGAVCDVCREEWPCPEADQVVTPGYVEWCPVSVGHWKWDQDGRFRFGHAALVLAWDEAPVWQGMAWAHRAEQARHDHGGESWPSYAGMNETLKVARYWESVGLGTLVLLDDHGKVVE